MNQFCIEKDQIVQEKLLDCFHDLDSVSRRIGEPQKEALIEWAKCWGGFLCNEGIDYMKRNNGHTIPHGSA